MSIIIHQFRGPKISVLVDLYWNSFRDNGSESQETFSSWLSLSLIHSFLFKQVAMKIPHNNIWKATHFQLIGETLVKFLSCYNGQQKAFFQHKEHLFSRYHKYTAMVQDNRCDWFSFVHHKKKKLSELYLEIEYILQIAKNFKKGIFTRIYI